ncbi:MAG: calcium-binding EGF-like domain-containing protein [Cryomorphaceae bacterium]
MRIWTFCVFILGLPLISCTDDDRCKDLICLNGGVCLDGICDCPPGYVGFNCQDFEACDSITCLNGGVCDSGICDCPPGYSGTSCQIFDPCTVLICENGGSCVNGFCECPPYYQGVTCGEQITPFTVSLTEIHVIIFPALDENEQPWDLSSMPDILPKISKGSEVLYTAPSPSFNADLDENHTWQLIEPIEFTEIFEVHNFKLLEVDELGNSREMGKIYFSPYNSNTDFPETLEFTSDSLKFKLQVEYTW